jgi:hypothetical protein
MTSPELRTGDSSDAMRWVWRGSALALVLIGWVFILVKNNFHVTPPVVIVGLGYLAGVAAVYTLFRTGAAAVARNEEDDGDAAWGKPIGKKGELDREKRALIKAIKEAEFDHQMGKLSKRDADDMIAMHRARAIEVIKELDRLDAGRGTARDQIQREVRARLEVEVKADPKAKQGPGSKKKDKQDKRQQRADALKDAVAAAAPAEAAKADDAAKAGDETVDASELAKASEGVGAGDAELASETDANGDAAQAEAIEATATPATNADTAHVVTADAAAAVSKDEPSTDAKEATP